MYYKFKKCAIVLSWLVLAVSFITFVFVFSLNASHINFNSYLFVCGLIYYAIGFFCLLIYNVRACKNIKDFSLIVLILFLFGLIISSIMLSLSLLNDAKLTFNILMGLNSIIYAAAFICFLTNSFLNKRLIL